MYVYVPPRRLHQKALPYLYLILARLFQSWNHPYSLMQIVQVQVQDAQVEQLILSSSSCLSLSFFIVVVVLLLLSLLSVSNCVVVVVVIETNLCW